MDEKKPLFNANEAEEYFTVLCTSYRDTANDIFKRDNKGRHVSDQIYSADYQKYLGMQIAMLKVLEYFSKFELEDQAIRAQQEQENNAPLTLDELRVMDGDPVYIIRFEDNRGWWVVIHGVTKSKLTTDYGSWFALEDYGKTWIAYRHKPEEDNGV